MRRFLGLCGFVLLPLLTACPVEDQVCFADGDCPGLQVCLERPGEPSACVGATDGGARDAGARDGAVDQPDTGTPDTGTIDGGPMDGGPMDGGPMDGSVDGGCPARPVDVFGMPLPANQLGIGDRLLLHFDEANPPFADSAGFNLLAECTGAACPTTETCGVYDGAVVFDGVDDALTIDTSIPPFEVGGQAYGFETWFLPSTTNTSTQCLFEYTGKTAGTVRVTLQPDGSIQIHTGAGSAVRNVRDGNWWHLGVTRGIGGVQVTLNLEDVLSGVPDPSFVDDASIIRIGHCSDGRFYEGQMDELRMTRSELHPESDFSVSRRDVRVLWEQGDDLFAGNERLTETRLFAADAVAPAFSRDGDMVAYLRCGPTGDTCDLYRRDWAPGSAEEQLTTTGDLGRARISWLNDRRIYYTRGAACARSIVHYDFVSMAHTPVIGPGDYGDIDIGFVRELVSDAALFVIREPCGSGRSQIARIDDPNQIAGTPAVNEIYTLSSTVGEIVGIRAVAQYDPFESGYVYTTIREVGGAPRMEVNFWNGPLFDVVNAFTTAGGTDLAPSHFTPSYFYYSAVPGPPWDHTDEPMLEVFLFGRDNGDVQRLTDDTIPSRRPTVWFARR